MLWSSLCGNIFKIGGVKKLSVGVKKQLVASIEADEDVAFYWCMVAVDMEETGTTLLKSIIELWITIRGFFFASVWVELCKQSASKSLQRSKGLRKKLFTR